MYGGKQDFIKPKHTINSSLKQDCYNLHRKNHHSSFSNNGPLLTWCWWKSCCREFLPLSPRQQEKPCATWEEAVLQALSEQHCSGFWKGLGGVAVEAPSAWPASSHSSWWHGKESTTHTTRRMSDGSNIILSLEGVPSASGAQHEVTDKPLFPSPVPSSRSGLENAALSVAPKEQRDTEEPQAPSNNWDWGREAIFPMC